MNICNLDLFNLIFDVGYTKNIGGHNVNLKGLLAVFTDLFLFLFFAERN